MLTNLITNPLELLVSFLTPLWDSRRIKAISWAVNPGLTAGCIIGAIFLPELALATVADITGGSAGFEKAAKDIYELATGGLGKTVAVTAAGLGIVGLATGFNTRVSAGALGTGLAVGLGPPVIVGVSGAAIF